MIGRTSFAFQYIRGRSKTRNIRRLGNDHRQSELGDSVEVLSEGQGQPYVAMRCRIAWEIAGMHGDAAPGEPLHVRHRRIIVEVCFVLDLLLKDRENPRRSLMSGRNCVYGPIGRGSGW